jgi:hypothetical protein
MGRIWGSPDVGLGEPFISVFLPGLLMRLLSRLFPRLLGFNEITKRRSKAQIEQAKHTLNEVSGEQPLPHQLFLLLSNAHQRRPVMYVCTHTCMVIYFSLDTKLSQYARINACTLEETRHCVCVCVCVCACVRASSERESARESDRGSLLTL